MRVAGVKEPDGQPPAAHLGAHGAASESEFLLMLTANLVDGEVDWIAHTYTLISSYLQLVTTKSSQVCICSDDVSLVAFSTCSSSRR